MVRRRPAFLPVNRNGDALSMRTWLPSILLVAPLALAGCRPGGSVSPIVDGGGGTGGVVQPGGDALYVAPAHVFSPRPHPPRSRPYAPPPAMAALPGMVERLEQCYPELRPRPEPKPVTKRGGGGSSGTIASGNGKGGGKGYGSGGGGSSGSGGYKNVPYQPAPSPSPSTSPSAPSGATTTKKSADGVAGGVVGGVAGGAAAGMAGGGGLGSAGQGRGAGTPPPSKDSAGSPVVASRGGEESRAKAEAPSRADRRAERKAEKEAQRRPASAPASAPAAESAAYEPAGYAVADEDERPQLAGGDVAYQRSIEDQYQDWGQATYLSNDDTMSLSSAQRIIYAIDRFLPILPEHIRPHELLNYFSFQTAPVAAQDDFSVLPNVVANPDKPGIYDLALAVQGRPVDRGSRRNANVTLVIDRSGSMSAEGRMEYLKRGLKRMTSELKDGDVVSMVLFDHEVCAPLENFVVGRDRLEVLHKAIDALRPRGATDVYSGLSLGYQIADRAYQPTYNNRVMLITDALANTGVTDTRSIAIVGKYYDDRRIRLSGVGVGTEFNDELLDRLTERGKGAYVFLGSEAEVDAVFGPRLISLLETTALDVHFQLHLPPSLRMNVFYGEEASAVKEEVQAIHYFANTSQLFFSEVMARGGKIRPQDQIMLTIEYQDPETGAAMVEERAWTLGEILGDAPNVSKARLLMAFVERLGGLAARPQPYGYRRSAGGWADDGGWQICAEGAATLDRLAQPIAGDGEVQRVRGLWDRLCSRYARPTGPVQPQPQPQGWPSAQG